MSDPVVLYTLILNDGSGQYYGGKTVNPAQRHRQHKNRWPDCEMIVQGCVPEDVRWQDAERAHISMLVDCGFDLANKNGGGGGVATHSDETKAKQSAAKKGKTRSPEAVAKTAAANRGRVHSPEVRARMSAGAKGKVITPETRAKLAAANRGKTQSSETRAKKSAATKGVPKSPEHRLAISKGKLAASARRKAEADARAVQGDTL